MPHRAAHRAMAAPPPPAQGAGEAQLPQKGGVLRQRRQLLRGRQQPQQDGQIVDRPLLPLARRGQIHRDAADGEPGAAGLDRRPDPLTDSRTAASGRPTTSKAGSPPDRKHSTVTSYPLMPDSPNERTDTTIAPSPFPGSSAVFSLFYHSFLRQETLYRSPAARFPEKCLNHRDNFHAP